MPARPSDRSKAEPAGKRQARSCPICGKPANEAAKPFCSDRCRDVDLNRWLSGTYAIPGKTQDDEDAE
ncbi:MAG TPA: DNA gyrase inhibitor YacG [Bradyrhizobium sp.]|jgi:hypothetical protein